MTEREVHVLVVIPGGDIAALPAVLTVAKEHRLSIARLRTAGACVPDFFDSGDIVMELVGIAGQHGEDFQSDVGRKCPHVTVNEVPIEEITAYMDRCPPCSSQRNSTLCIIKPHVVKSGDVGPCIEAILKAGFEIEGLFAIHMSIPICEELFGVYRGVYSSYSKTIEEICSGPVLAVMVTGTGDHVVEDFRSFCGPIEPELAKVLRPNSLRARFGINSFRNGVHCTDLPNDGPMETKYVFETLGAL